MDIKNVETKNCKKNTEFQKYQISEQKLKRILFLILESQKILTVGKALITICYRGVLRAHIQ